MRVTASQVHRTQIARIQSKASEAARAERVAASGRRIESPSDDPIGAARAERVRAMQTQVAASRGLIERAERDLGRQEQAIGSMTDVLSRARELAVQLANPIADAGTRALGGAEVGELRASVIALANTAVSGKRIFAGSQTGSDAFDATGAYQGDANAASVVVDSSASVQTTMAGDALLSGTSGGPNILQGLSDLQTALAANDVAGVQAELDRLGAGIEWLAQQRGTVGARMRTAESLDSHLADVELRLTDERSALEDADVTVAFSELVRTKTAYESALQVTAAARVDDVFGLLGL